MKSYKKGLLALLALFLSVSISTVGFSSFVINNKLNTTSTIQINKTNKDEKVKISFKYQVCTGYKETEGNEEAAKYNNVEIGTESITNKKEYNKFFEIVNALCETGFSSDSVEENSTTPYKKKGKGDYRGYNVYIKVSKKIEPYKQGLGVITHYRGEYTITVKKVNVQLVYDFPSTSTSITIDKGSSIPTSFIKNNFYKNSNSKNYEFVGFKEVGSDGKPSDSFISLDKTFITDTTLYAVFNSKTLDGDTNYNKYNLSDTVNNTSSGTVDFNAGVAVGKLNLSNDFTWLDSEKKVFLGGANTMTTIKKRVTARFLFNDGSESKKNEFNSESVYVEPVERNRQYTVVLQNDLIINGQMQVEGNYGVNTSGITQGVIAKEYICLDLNGHNITINNGGKLISDGLIIDSVGTGQINVEGGGFLRTLAVIHDYRGGTITQSYVNNDVFPFQVYQLPYLRCKARVKYDQTNGWGSLNGYVNAQAFRDVVVGDLTILKGQQEFELNFIGPSNSNYFIKLDKPSANNEDSYVDVIGYKENSINENKLYSISQRVKIIINNCSVSIGEFKFNIKVSGISISVDTSKYSLPISSFFDLEIKNSFLTLDKRIKFLPGSSLIVDKNSTTLLSYDKKAKRAGQISVLDKSYYYYDKNYKYVTTDLIKLADMSGSNATEKNISGDVFGQQVFKAQSFQKYKSNPNVQIKGTLLFKTGNDSGMDYQLSGTINLSKIGYTSDGTLSSSTIVNSDNPFSELNKQSVKVITYGYDYMIGDCTNNSHVKGFSRPLVSNETAYYNDGTNSYVGTYEYDGIFRANSKTYYFNNDGKYKTNDTTLPTLKECDYDSNSKIITDNNQQYIYIASMYCKLTSTDNKTGTVDHTRLSENATVDSKVKYDNTLGKWVRG